VRSVVALAGGVGAARLLRGIVRIIPPDRLTVVGNTGDDLILYGLHVSPDLDTIMYTLSGLEDETKGWGIAEDTFNCLHMLDKLGFETWFKLGDRDLATHIARTEMLRSGHTLSETTSELCKRLKIGVRLIPMSDDTVQTTVFSGQKRFEFQQYFVKRGAKDEVTKVTFEGSENARPSPGILEAMRAAETIMICPSNPILSISPILSIPAIENEMRRTKARVVAISPIVGGKAIKGPADKIMASLGLEVSPYGIAKFYEDYLDCLIIDRDDERFKTGIERLGIKVVVANTVMRNVKDSICLGKTALEACL
jgi:LPPG:FO 2-phospho-L-lactate transferase